MRNRFQSAVYAGQQERAVREHEQHYARQRRTSARARMYHTAAWRALRASQLEAFPNCQARSCTRAATVVDHVVAHGGSNSLFHDPANLQSLCKRCHDSKTARYDGGFGRARANAVDDDNGFGLL